MNERQKAVGGRKGCGRTAASRREDGTVAPRLLVAQVKLVNALRRGSPAGSGKTRMRALATAVTEMDERRIKWGVGYGDRPIGYLATWKGQGGDDHGAFVAGAHNFSCWPSTMRARFHLGCPKPRRAAHSLHRCRQQDAANGSTATTSLT